VAKGGVPAWSGASCKRVPVIQSLHFFGFGFVCALLLALLAAPSFWRRAVRLTERRIQATIPLTMNEIRAEKDALRAGFAMATRRLEMKVKDLKGRVAGQMVEIERVGGDLRQAAGERDRLKEEGAALEAKNGELESALKESSAGLHALSAKLDEIGVQMQGKDAEITRLDLAATDANLEVSNRQIELVARETEIAKLKGDLARLREQRREGEEKLRQSALDSKSGREALKTERARANDLERRLEKSLATLADREEMLERKERELAGSRASLGRQAVQAEEKAAPEATAGSAALPRANETAPAEAGVSVEQQAALARLATERKRLEERLTTLTRENKRLRTASLPPQEQAPLPEGGGGETALRERISDLAAEMAALTALIEGPDSPIDKAIALPETEHPGGPAGGGTPSLAERIRALREAAARMR
jgi:chromosome segregation ATPase